MVFKVAGCAGHGGFNSTPGKRSPDGEFEWDFNNKVIRAFETELLTYEGVEFKRFDDPTGKTDVPLKTRTDGANKWGADIYLSFHHNAKDGTWGTATGVETYTQKGVTGAAVDLAKLIHPAMVGAYGLKDRGLKTNDFHITRETKMPAVLMEGGFMDSKTDIIKLRDNKVLEKAGKDVATAVAKYKGLKKKAITPVKSDPNVYVVKSGDTLWGISMRTGVGVQKLIVLNSMKSDTIFPGQQLKLK